MSSISPTVVFYAQFAVTVIGLTLSSAMIVMNSNNSTVFLPILTSLLFSWLPSPSSPPDLSAHTEKLNSILSEVQNVKLLIPQQQTLNNPNILPHTNTASEQTPSAV